VTFCNSPEAVYEAFHTILAGEHKNHCGDKYKHYTHAGVLLQEYLKGQEHIVNCVVLDGVVKTTAMFEYDKRPYNGAAFVCFSKELVVLGDGDSKLLELQEYTERVLQAVGFRNGAIHAEVMYTVNRGPVLVELNCRLHGGNGQWVHPAERCMGYNQLSVFMDAYLHGGVNDFEAIPSRPERAHEYCHQVKMRSHIEGIMDGVIESQWARIEALPSYVEHCFGVRPGDQLLRTVDMPSVPGEVTLIHHDRQVLANDYHKLNEILAEGIFKVVSDDVAPQNDEVCLQEPIVASM
jgi:biotin carboxylase